MAQGVRLRHCHSLEEFQACLGLQKAVWGGDDLDVVPLPLFVVAAETGGQVLGAFQESGRMIGFTLALAAVREGRPFLHSHMTAVLPEYQNRGIGRQLKLFQREDAVRRGLDLVEWTFDPLELRNAHFNLVRLGAIVRRFLPNCYGVTSSPLHAGLPTDRLVAEWWLGSARVECAMAGKMQSGPTPRKDVVRVTVPQNIADLKRSQPAEAIRVQGRIREQFQEWFGRRYAATGLERDDDGGSYVLEPFDPPLIQPARKGTL